MNTEETRRFRRLEDTSNKGGSPIPTTCYLAWWILENVVGEESPRRRTERPEAN